MMSTSTEVILTLDLGMVLANGLIIFLITFFGILFYFKKQTILK